MRWNLKASVVTGVALGALLAPMAAHAHPGPHEGDTTGLLHAVARRPRSNSPLEAHFPAFGTHRP